MHYSHFIRHFSSIFRLNLGYNFHCRRQLCQQVSGTTARTRKDDYDRKEPKILDRELDPEVEVLEYIEMEEEGVEAPMVAQIEPYLRRDLVKRPISALTIDEFLTVLKDQQAKNISTYRQPQPQKKGQEGEETPSSEVDAVTIICSPHNRRHAKTLEQIIRAFIKRNFHFENEKEMPKRTKKAMFDRGGWCTLQFGKHITFHIMEENLRQKYELEKLVQGEDAEMNFYEWSKCNEFSVLAEFSAKEMEEEEEKRKVGKKKRRQTGGKNDEFITPCI